MAVLLSLDVETLLVWGRRRSFARPPTSGAGIKLTAELGVVVSRMVLPLSVRGMWARALAEGRCAKGSVLIVTVGGSFPGGKGERTTLEGFAASFIVNSKGALLLSLIAGLQGKRRKSGMATARLRALPSSNEKRLYQLNLNRFSTPRTKGCFTW